MKDKELKIFAGKGKVLRQLARDPEWSKKLDQARTDAEIINVLREFSKAKRHSFKEEKV